MHLPKVTVKCVAFLRRIREILASEFGPKPAKLTDVSSSMPMSVQQVYFKENLNPFFHIFSHSLCTNHHIIWCYKFWESDSIIK